MTKLEQMKNGQAVSVTNDDLLEMEDASTNEDWMNLRTANNLDGSGFVAWLKGTPPGFQQKPTPDGIMIAYARPGQCTN